MNIDSFLEAQEKKTLCRFVTCGSVDDGKSTLIGRLLYDSGKLFQDQLEAVKADSKKMGTVEGDIDFAFLVDGLESEREQGITIDVAYRFFETDRRKFIIADTPGHEQYTRNMATGASTAEVALILIDARKGVLPQTKRHSYITSLMGIRHLVVVVNKMDLVDFSQSRFEEIQEAYRNLIPHLPYHPHLDVHFIPISALDGDNLFSLSPKSPWYQGKPLMELLDTLEVEKPDVGNFRFPVQYVSRPHQNFRGLCGMIASGHIMVGDRVTVLPSRKTSKVKSIISYPIKNLNSGSPENSLGSSSNFSSSSNFRGADDPVETVARAFTPMTATLVLEDEIDVSRGDMIVKSDDIPTTSDCLSVVLIWMNEAPMHLENGYIIKRASSIIAGKFTAIEYRKDIHNLSEEPTEILEWNDIGRCVLELERPLAVDVYATNRRTGSFIVIDRHTDETLGAGMIIQEITQPQAGKSGAVKEYSQSEIALNRHIRKHFPEWDCREIF